MRKIHIGDTVYFETLDGKTDSMVVAEIVRDKLYDDNGAFLIKDDVVKITRPSLRQPLEQREPNKAVAWLEAQSGKVVTKKMIKEFINYMSNERN
jgi:hypothetical protein